MNIRQKKLLLCTLTAFMISGIAAQPLGSFIPFLRDSYNLSYEVSGILLSCQSFGNLCAILISGVLPFWLGRRKSILITAVWMAAAYIIFVSGFGSPALLILAFLMTGISRGGNSNFASTMILTLPKERYTVNYNLLHGCFAIGALLSPIALVLITSKNGAEGWRIMAGIICVICIIQLVIYAKMPLPEESGKKGVKSIERGFLKDKRFWLAALMLFFYISTEYAIVGWLVTYFQDEGILSAEYSQLMNSLLWTMILIGRMTGAIIGKKVPKSKLLLADGVGMMAFFLLMFFSRSTAGIIIGLAGVGLFMATIYPTAQAVGGDAIPGNDFGSSLMILFGSFGGVITPALVGFVAEHSGIRAGMGLIVVYTALLLICIILSVLSIKKERA